ncbi:MAG: ATP-binding protein [Calothrix sp. C42_A2020_038]|nr:ATP-binding protein [Calothrix sp. C42_A2020_038]
MLRSPNPFVVGKPVPAERFVGRESEIAAAFDQIYNRSHIAVWGGSGMGKSSFLQKLESPQTWVEHGLDALKAVVVRFSCEGITPFSSSAFWGEALTLLKDKLEGELEQAEIEALLQKTEKTKDDLRQILKVLGRKNKFLVLLIDDYDVALNTNEYYDEKAMQKFLSECRNLAVHSAEGQYLSTIVTSRERLSESGPQLNPNASPWYNHYLFLQLKPFNNLEIDQILKILRIPDLREAIRETTGGHPALLQIAGFLLYRDLETANAPSMEAFVKEFESTSQPIFQDIWKRCSENEQTLLMLMALSALKGRLHQQRQFDVSGIEFIFSQKERELSKLEEQGIINHTSNEEKTKNIYFFTSSTMERWVIQELWQTDEKWLDARQKVFLNLMSKEQREKINKSIQWLWNNRKELPSVLEWFGKLATAFPKGFILPNS